MINSNSHFRYLGKVIHQNNGVYIVGGKVGYLIPWNSIATLSNQLSRPLFVHINGHAVLLGDGYLPPQFQKLNLKNIPNEQWTCFNYYVTSENDLIRCFP